MIEEKRREVARLQEKLDEIQDEIYDLESQERGFEDNLNELKDEIKEFESKQNKLDVLQKDGE